MPDTCYPDDTIVAVSTPVGEGGIGIVRISGPSAIAIADAIFVAKDGSKPSEQASHTVHYGHIVTRARRTGGTGTDADTPGAMIDEVLLTVMCAPRTYTREDIVEINCHGGLEATRKVLEHAAASGARIAEPGEFTKRAFLNGRIDLVQAEAVLDVIRSKTDRSLAVAMSQLEGDLSRSVNGIRDAMLEIAAHLEASIDFPDEELDILAEGGIAARTAGTIAALRKLIATFADGAVMREGVLAVICGKPNAGKSSLMNLLLKRDRVIVTPVPGTTRDAVEEMISLKGIPIRLVDTAGITTTRDRVEREGIKHSAGYVKRADIVLLVLDGSTAFDAKDRAVIRMVQAKKKVVIINKSDRPQRIDERAVARWCPPEAVVRVSVAKKRNIAALEERIARAVLGGGYLPAEGAIVANVRHKRLLDKALSHMLSMERSLAAGLSAEVLAIDLKEALYELGLIVGKSVSDDVLDRIFERFCIGK